jgi:YD repeat-containing protein
VRRAAASPFTYTATGQRLQMTYGSEITNYQQYDNRDQLTLKHTLEGDLIYTYDAHENVTRIQSSNTNGARMTYTYDALNRLSRVCDKRLDATCAGPGITNKYGRHVGTRTPDLYRVKVAL